VAETAVRRETVAVRTELADEELTCEVNGCSASVVGSLHPRQLPGSVGALFKPRERTINPVRRYRGIWYGKGAEPVG